ncbi:hypothetical protein OG292_12980 [Streptomyces sp. NBC_01511]|uniref:hypothetical protein n=1 Tax=Streptomyces sp. NBC_01511 TaxID=2903889 RepID=UPI00387080BC
MHHHGYLWVGEKARFDTESTRRPATSLVEPTPTGPPEVLERYRQAVAEFAVTDVPPIETALWLKKPSKLIRGTWEEPKDAAGWLGRQLAEYAPRFASEQDAAQVAPRTASAVDRLGRGGDVSLGYYLRRPYFLSVSVVTCSPNRAAPDLVCPAH